MISMSHKHTIEFINSEFEKRGCKLLDTEYKNAHSKLQYIASCGHQACINWCNFSHGSGTVCPKCADTKKTYEFVRGEFEKRGCKLLSTEYKGALKDLEYIAKCGHKHRIKWSNFQQGTGTYCPKCANLNVAKKNKISIKAIREIFEAEGCKLLSVSRKSYNSKLRYIARCGHEHKITYGNFALGHGRLCPRCSRNDMSENFIGDILDTMVTGVKRQYKIRDGIGGTLRIDFFIPSIKIAIEYNGEQHYGPTAFFGGEERYKLQMARDSRKRNWCRSHGIRLIEIDGRKLNCRKSTEADVRLYLSERLNLTS